MPRRPRHVARLLLILFLALAWWLPAASPLLYAQADARAALVGTWRLNRDGEAGATTPDPGSVGGRRGGFGGGGGRRGGGGGFGGFGGFPGGGGGRAQASDPEAARAERARMVALFQELMAPQRAITIAAGPADIVAFTDDQGRTTRLQPNNRKEKHQLTNGTIETKTRWDKGVLREEIRVDGGMTLMRSWHVDADSHQLVVETTVDGGRDGRPNRLVYDREDDR